MIVLFKESPDKRRPQTLKPVRTEWEHHGGTIQSGISWPEKTAHENAWDQAGK